MPADHGLWPNDYEMILPPRPEAGEHDPESTIEGRESGPPLLMGIDRELLPQGKLHDGLLLVASEEGEGAVTEQRCETDQSAHGDRDRAGLLGPERV